jgi:hypothetical protein
MVSLAESCDARDQSLGPSERAVRRHRKDYGSDSHRSPAQPPKPVTDASRHTVIESLSDVPLIGVVKERGIQRA